MRLLIASSKVMKNAIENKTANDASWNFLARKIRIKRNHITISNLEFLFEFLLLIRVTPFWVYALLQILYHKLFEITMISLEEI